MTTKDSDFSRDFSIEINHKIRDFIKERDHIRKYESTLSKEIHRLIRLIEKITGEK